MTVEKFINSNQQADIAIKLFNDHYAGQPCYIDNNRDKKGIVIGLNKHLSYGSYDPISPCYRDKQFVSLNLIHRAISVVYTVSFRVGGSHVPKVVSIELFMKANNSCPPSPVLESKPVQKRELSF